MLRVTITQCMLARVALAVSGNIDGSGALCFLRSILSPKNVKRGLGFGMVMLCAYCVGLTKETKHVVNLEKA